MATKAQGRKPATKSQKSPASRSGGAVRPKPAATRRQPAQPVETPGLLDGHGADLAGIFVLALAVVSVFGVWLSSNALVPRALATALGATIGVLTYLTPALLAAAGIALIRGRQDDLVDEDTGEITTSSTVKRWVGVALALVMFASIAQVIVQPGSVDTGGVDVFQDAGGLLGALVGLPLGQLIGAWGAGLVFVLGLVVALSLIVNRSVRDLAVGAIDLARPAVGAIVDGFRGLFQLGADAGDSSDEPRIQLFDQDLDPDSTPAKPRRSRARKPAEPTIVVPVDANAAVSAEQLEIQLEPRNPNSPWTLPPLSLLSRSKAQEIDQDAIAARGRELEAALAEHGVTTRLSGMVVGPTVTRYELELGVGVKVSSVVNLSRDIAYAMATPDVRILAPIPGKQAIGVEIPNRKRQIIALGDILTSPEAMKAKSPLAVAVGKDIDGKSLIVDLAAMPHLLIAGQTGAGKSSCINSIMTSILMRATPDDVRLILIDPKRVELTQYNRVPHLLTQVVTNPKKAANALAWAVAEMERRYELLEEIGVRDIGGYNAAFDRGDLQARFGEERDLPRLPLILIVVDELADLMMVAARDVEESINRIAAKARAVGLHLVIATQRPSVNVITGVIKANIPARFAFSVASATDSKVIMNTGGAERLVGQGDMLFLGPTTSTAERVQGCWVEEREAAAVVALWRKQAPDVAYDEAVQVDSNLAIVAAPGSGGSGGDDDDDELTWQAMELVVRSQLGSTSMLQRKLKVGFARAGRLMDMLEERGVVGPGGGSKPREVLLSVEEFEELLATR